MASEARVLSVNNIDAAGKKNLKNQVPFIERISYGLGDTASNLTFQMVTMFLLFFYTDVFGLPLLAIGTLFLVARVWDAVNDPIMGIIIDRTNSKWGKCRPWFLWMAIPYAVLAVLTFTVPDLGATGKLIWAYVTYIGLGMVYTAINIPLSAILPSLTDNLQERTDVTSIRMLLAMAGGIIVSIFTMPLVQKFGAGDQGKGFQLTMVLFASIAVVFFLLAFFFTRERVSLGQSKPTSIKAGIASAKKNLPWIIVLLVNLTMWLGMTMKNGTAIYYLQYNLGRPDLIPMFMPMSIFAMLPGIALVPVISRWMGKRNTTMFGFVISVIGIVMMGMAGTNIGLLFAGNIIAGVGSGLPAGTIFAMMSDTVDFGEWKSGVRAQGFLYAAASFGVKLGMSLGGALSAWILSVTLYVPNAEQADLALKGIAFNFIWASVITTILCIILLNFYKLDKQMPSILEDLKTRRVA